MPAAPGFNIDKALRMAGGMGKSQVGRRAGRAQVCHDVMLNTI